MFPQYFFRITFILLLLGSSFSASLFMVLESAEFYRGFYPPEDTVDFGLWAAILNEVFLVIMSAVWLPKIDTGKKKQFHPGNLLIKLLMLFLFINTVGGASLNVISSNLDKLQQEQNRIGALETLKKQIVESRSSLEAFVEQNQPLNTAITAKNLTEINLELKELQLSQKSTFALWLDILLLFILRFTIQLGNITSIWLASWLFRQPITASGIFHAASAGALRDDLKTAFDFSDKPLPSPEPVISGTYNPKMPETEAGVKNNKPQTELKSHPHNIPENAPVQQKELKSHPHKIPENASAQQTPNELPSETKTDSTEENTPPLNNHTPVPPVPSVIIEDRAKEYEYPDNGTEKPPVISAIKEPPKKPVPNTKTEIAANNPAAVKVEKINIQTPKSEQVNITKTEPLDDDPEADQLADDINEMWLTVKTGQSINDFCTFLGINRQLFNCVLQRELSGISLKELRRMHRQMKERFESDQVYT